ncbi:MAG: hypothetical protein PHX61_02810 [Alphaproteobacteria bacterium]|nr:hypothetical protein [Alphaproteobacteria bacterium]
MSKDNEGNHLENLKQYMHQNKTILQFDYADGEGFYISEKMNPINFPKSYIISADYLIEASKGDEMGSVIVWPVLYLYRHAVELFLKQALQKLQESTGGHDISKLYGLLESKLKAFEIQHKDRLKKFDLFPSEDDFFSIMQFHSISPRSTELRYTDAGLVGGDSHMLFANFTYARSHARRASDYFDKLDNIIQFINTEAKPDE